MTSFTGIEPTLVETIDPVTVLSKDFRPVATAYAYPDSQWEER